MHSQSHYTEKTEGVKQLTQGHPGGSEGAGIEQGSGSMLSHCPMSVDGAEVRKGLGLFSLRYVPPSPPWRALQTAQGETEAHALLTGLWGQATPG